LDANIVKFGDFVEDEADMVGIMAIQNNDGSSRQIVLYTQE